MSVLLEGDTVIQDEEALWSGLWQFSKEKKVGVSFNYQWISSSLPRDLLDYVSFVPSPSDPVPVSTGHSGRGRGRGRGRSSTNISRGIGRGVSRGGIVATSAADVCYLDTDIITSDQEHSAEHAIDIDLDIELNEQDGEDGDESKLCDDMFDNDDTNGDVEEMIDAVIEAADSSATAMAADSVTIDASDQSVSGNSVIDLPISSSPVVIRRTHPLFGLWTGSFDVRGVNGALDQVKESFFFHSFMNQDPSDDLLDLPQEPQSHASLAQCSPISSQTGTVTKSQSASELITVATEGAPEGVVDSLVKEMAGSGPDIAACSTSGNTVDAEAVDTTNFENESAHEGEVEIDNATSLTGMQGTQEISMVVGEPFTTYIVGFGRNPFGRFSLTAAWNEQTGRMRCEKKYITSKGSGRRGRRPGSTFSAPSSRLSIESTGSDVIGEGASSVRAMSTRPRKSLPDSSYFFPSSYDEAQQLTVPGPHVKKRKSSTVDDMESGTKLLKEKLGGSHQKHGMPFPSTPSTTAFQLQREKEREKERERLREKERDLELERELDDSKSNYRVAFLDDETGEVYEGGWYPHTQRRHGAGICLFADGTLYEGGWLMGREHGKGQLMTGERQIIYVGEWVDGTMTGHGTYTFSNGDRYTGDWREGIRHGKGEYLMSNGCSYVGDWKNNKRTGGGVFKWSDGSTYDGDWENDNRHGRGLLTLANGFSYDGQWYHNYMEGRGVSVYPGGQEYQGSYKAGLREGRGSIKFCPGAVYEGRFRDDRIDGQGTIVVTETMPGSEGGEILIPIQIQADIRRIHLKAGFGADAAH